MIYIKQFQIANHHYIYNTECEDKEFFTPGVLQDICNIPHTSSNVVAFNCDSMKKLGLCHMTFSHACSENMPFLSVKELCQSSCDNCLGKSKN